MSDVTNFLTLLYRSVIPAKSKPEVKEEARPIESGNYSGYGIISPYRYHAQYSTPLDRLGSAGKYMSNQFNAYCSEAGVQCIVTMDPRDFQQLFQFKNLGDKLILIEWNRGEFHYLEPHESLVCKVPQGMDGMSRIPRITSLNNGV